MQATGDKKQKNPKIASKHSLESTADQGSNCSWNWEGFAHFNSRCVKMDRIRKYERARTLQPLDALEIDPSKTWPYTEKKLLGVESQLNRSNRDEGEKRSRINWGRGTEQGHLKKQATILITYMKTTEEGTL